MKLVFTRWKDVKSFLVSIDEPVSDVFCLKVSKIWQRKYAWQKYVYEVEIPREFIDRRALRLFVRGMDVEDSRIE